MAGLVRGDEVTTVTRELFKTAATAWADRALGRTLNLMTHDVIRTVNVDGEVVPYAATAKGKAEVGDKLRLLLDTFEFGAYVTDRLHVRGNVARARMKIIYIHNDSGERLITSFRLVVTQRDGLIARIDEYHDAAYLESFTRLVAMFAKRKVRRR